MENQLNHFPSHLQNNFPADEISQFQCTFIEKDVNFSFIIGVALQLASGSFLIVGEHLAELKGSLSAYGHTSLVPLR